MKKLLYEVSIIRPLVIFLLVVMHSFTMYDGGWPLPEGIRAVPVYAWLVDFISGFRIETIALIAGYVFAYQSIDLDKHYKLSEFAIKKFKRLIIPCILFSICYYFLFLTETYELFSLKFFLRLSSGFGHMWFLPMLFWCFIVLWIVDYYKLYSKIFFFALALVSILPIPTMPLGFSRVFHFAFYCILGYHIYRYKDRILEIRYLKWSCLLFYLILVVINNIVPSGDSFPLNIVHRIIKLCLACSGIFALYLIVSNIIYRYPDYKPKDWIIKSSGLCYGVYIYHQFILKYLYYYTPIPELVGTYLLPWIGLSIALMISVVATSLTLRTKFGRFLIG